MSGAEIVCLGHAALDRIYRIEAFPPVPQKLAAAAMEEVGGGMAANAAVAAARLGARVAFCGRVGDDMAGHAIRAGLEREGVDTAGLRAFPGAVSSTSAVIVEASGERLLVNHRGSGIPEGAAWLDLSAVRGARAVLVDVRWPAGARALLRAARAAGVPTVLDGDVGAGEALPGLLAEADYVLFSAPGLSEFAPGAPVSAALERAMGLGPRHAGVSCGSEGYVWRDEAGLQARAAFAIRAVDTSGAGDAFHGGFVWGLAAGYPVIACIDVGQATAALKCLQPGNRAGLPGLAAVAALIAGDVPGEGADVA